MGPDRTKGVTSVNAEKRLRARIKRILLLAGLAQTQTTSILAEVEDRIVELFRAYSKAPEDLKDTVYSSGEEGIFRTLRRLNRNQGRLAP